MTYSINSYRLVALAALVGFGSSFAACSSDSQSTGPTNIDAGGSGGKTGTGGATSGGGKSSAGGGGGAGGKSTGGATNDTDGGGGTATGGSGTGGAPGDSGACTEDTATTCLECPNVPTNDKEFMNHCTTGCIKFTTTSTVPAKADLPAIP